MLNPRQTSALNAAAVSGVQQAGREGKKWGWTGPENRQDKRLDCINNRLMNQIKNKADNPKRRDGFAEMCHPSLRGRLAPWTGQVIDDHHGWTGGPNLDVGEGLGKNKSSLDQ
jgi:hypothetical protein